MYTTVVIYRNLTYGAVAQGAHLQRLCDAAGLPTCTKPTSGWRV
jgi:hypothetical protein